MVVLGRYVPQFSFLHILLGDEAVLVAEARFYQRLLAMDDHEARAVADLYLSENSLPQLYDGGDRTGADAWPNRTGTKERSIRPGKNSCS